MKKLLQSFAATFLICSPVLHAQQQLGNGNMESWDNVGQATEEPTNWNSFKSGTGSFVSFGSQQIQRSTAIRAGATGSYCARVWSKSTLGIVANGNMTIGQINMGSSTPSSSSNYNFSKTSDVNFSEVMTSSPDSLVFWVKYTAGAGNQARVNAIIHDNYDLRDPQDAASIPHIVGTATLNYPPTAGVWVRKSVPFLYNGSATSPQFILITFTTNMTPGGGAANDEILIDDIQLIYNPVNQPIVANDDAVTTSQDIAAVISVLSNDTDPENAINSNSITIVSNPSNGVVSVNTTTGQITYTPNTGFFGTDAFTYSVCDGGTPVTCDQAIVNITVNQVIVGNNQVIANNDNVSTNMNVPVVITVLSNDVDPENQLNINSLAVVTSPSNGTCTVNTTTGEITYTPSTGYFGNDVFTYTICDEFAGASPTCDTATVNIIVNLNWGIGELGKSDFNVYYSEGSLFFTTIAEDGVAEYAIYSLGGQLVQKGEIAEKVSFVAPKGMYLVKKNSQGTIHTSRIIVY